MTVWRARLKELIPDSVLKLRRQILVRKNEKELQRYASAKDAFTRVYEAGYWGRSDEPGEGYYSGHGSHMGYSVTPYVSAVCGFLQSFGEKPDVVDLGCGDFNIGSRIRPYCGKYVGVDVVEGLVKRNIEKYGNANVDFRAIDITNEDLPKGDVVFIRQVLQHLSNSEIEKVVAKLPTSYRFIVLTEHLPVDSFVPNQDKPRGFQVRLELEKAASGIVLTKPPFKLKVARTTTLCEAFETLGDRKGVIRTILYEL
jgi:SAM-dependent methyltransferase